jgi:RNA polymerase sigma-70 factor (ECF subfamily)
MTSMAVGQMALDGPSDTLVAAAKAGDRAAFAALVTRYRDTVYAYALARLRDREEAEDVAQETFVRAYLGLGRLRGPEAWEAWVMRIARNLCSDTLRRKRVRQAEPIDPDWLDGSPSPEMQALAGERRRELSQAVADLPEPLRVAVLMHYASGRTYREIAAALGLPQSTVVGRIARALLHLRRRLGVETPR